MSEWDEWKQQQEEKLHPKVELPEAKKSKEAIIKRLVTPNELAKLKALQHINPAWWCGDSRFIEQFADATDETQITERQAWYIKVLWYKYRRQLGHDGPKPEGYNNR